MAVLLCAVKHHTSSQSENSWTTNQLSVHVEDSDNTLNQSNLQPNSIEFTLEFRQHHSSLTVIMVHNGPLPTVNQPSWNCCARFIHVHSRITCDPEHVYLNIVHISADWSRFLLVAPGMSRIERSTRLSDVITRHCSRAAASVASCQSVLVRSQAERECMLSIHM